MEEFVKRDFCDDKEPGMGLDSYSKVGFCPSVTDGIGSACAPLLALWARTDFGFVHSCSWQFVRLICYNGKESGIGPDSYSIVSFVHL